MAVKLKRTSFAINPILWANFQSAAKDRGYSAAGALRVLMIQFIKKGA